MITVLVADSDRDNRKRIRDIINSANLGYRVTAEAENGKAALDHMAKSKIDLVICDLRMPVMTGYHLFQKIRFSYPATKVVLYASYGEYDVLKKAEEEGLLDHIYKPVQNVELERCLQRIKPALIELEKKDQSEKNINERYEHLIPVFKERFLINLLHGRLRKDSEINRNFDYFDITIKPGFTVLLVKIDYFEKLSLVFEEKDREIFTFTLAVKIEQFFKGVRDATVFIDGNDEIAVILGESLSANDTIQIAVEIKGIVKRETVTTATVGIGTVVDTPSQIVLSYRQARAAIRYNYYYGCDSAIHIKHVEAENSLTYKYPVEKEALLIQEIVIGNTQKALSYWESLYDFFKSYEKLPEKLLPKIILNIVVSISRYASEHGIQLEELFAENVSVKEISKREDPEAAFNYLKIILIKASEYIESIRTKREEALLKRVEEYAKEHFADNLTLQNMSDMFDIAAEYLEKLFKQHHNVSFNEFYTKIRMDKAKEFIDKTDMDDIMISLKLGYDNLKYFTGVFFQTEGISIVDYRRQQKRYREWDYV